MRYTLLLGLLAVLIMFGCTREEFVAKGLCLDTTPFALDITDTDQRTRLFWLNDAEGLPRGASEDLLINRGIIHFYNYEQACDLPYSLSAVGLVSNLYHSINGGSVRELNVKQIERVPSGRSVNFGAFKDLFYTEKPFYLNGRFASVSDYPEIAAVRLLNQEALLDAGSSVPFSYYIHTNNIQVNGNLIISPAEINLLKLQKAEDGSWWGHPLNWRIGSAYTSFQNYLPLTTRNLQLNIPAAIDSVHTEIRWLRDDGQVEATLVDVFRDETSLECLVPPTENGFLIKHILHGENSTYITQRYYPEWPETITVRPALKVDALSIDYPEVEFSSDYGDLLHLRGQSGNLDTLLLIRQSVLALRNGKTKTELSDSGPALSEQFNVDSLRYVHALTEEIEATVYDYPLLGGDYQEILKSGFKISNTQENWLRTQVYEAVRRKVE